MSTVPKNSVCSLLGDFDLFPDGLFSHLTNEELVNVKELLLGDKLEEKEIDLDRGE
jgi:hypothetical protein